MKARPWKARWWGVALLWGCASWGTAAESTPPATEHQRLGVESSRQSLEAQTDWDFVPLGGPGLVLGARGSLAYDFAQTAHVVFGIPGWPSGGPWTLAVSLTERLANLRLRAGLGWVYLGGSSWNGGVSLILDPVVLTADVALVTARRTSVSLVFGLTEVLNEHVSWSVAFLPRVEDLPSEHRQWSLGLQFRLAWINGLWSLEQGTEVGTASPIAWSGRAGVRWEWGGP